MAKARSVLLPVIDIQANGNWAIETVMGDKVEPTVAMYTREVSWRISSMEEVFLLARKMMERIQSYTKGSGRTVCSYHQIVLALLRR